MDWVDYYHLETWYRKYITLTYFFQFYPDKTLQNWMTINMKYGKNWKISKMLKKNPTN